jgi:AcrR family transcriptional regulator
MSYIAARREEEKERRRAEILDAAETLYVQHGWEGVTIDQVARSARLSRALVYVYFKDKDDVLFAIGERAMHKLHDRFSTAIADNPGQGRDQIEAIGRAYMGYAFEFPHYFDFCARFQRHTLPSGASANEAACHEAGDRAFGLVVQAIETAVGDGSVHPSLGKQPLMMAFSLWAFTHGITQIMMSKAGDLARFDIPVPDFGNYAFDLLRTLLRSAPRD